VGNAAIFIYIETFVSLILGYLFWIIMSKIGNTEIIGIASAVITFSGIISVLSHIGIPTGVQRFLGKSFAISSVSEIKTYLLVSTLLISITIGIVVIIVSIFRDSLLTSFKIDHELFFVSLLLIISTSYATFLRGVVVSSLQTKILTFAMTFSALTKLFLGIILLLWGMGALGLIVSFTINQLIVTAILAIHVGRIFKFGKLTLISIKVKLRRIDATYCKEILSSSIVYWIPLIITTVGSQIGTIFIYGSAGSKDAGLFFIALTIVTGITSVMYSLYTISFPAMSGMTEGRKRFITNVTRLSLIIAIPFSLSLIFYSDDILSLLGNDYIEGSTILDILLLSMLPTAIHYGITSFVYSMGNYRQVLYLGISTSVPRIVLYFSFIPFFGGVGGAIAFTVGSLIGFIYAIIVAKQNGIMMEWRKISLILAIPLIVTFILTLLKIDYIYGIVLNLCISYLVMYALKLILLADIRHGYRLLPSIITSRTNFLIKKLRGY
jgi:O-antigen/teichoic acid export membrane protein